VEKFVHKGSQIYIEGKLRTRQWTDQTGNKRFTTEVQADNIQLLGKRPDAPQGGQPGQGTPGGYQGQNGYSGQSGYQGGYAPASPAPQPAAPAYAPQPAQPVYPAPAAAPSPAEAPDDDLPF
jgi:single-strand DNA-binding protein